MPSLSQDVRRSPTRWTRYAVGAVGVLLACGESRPIPVALPDLILTNGRVYTLSWSEPSTDGAPAANAPFDSINGWRHDATAVAVLNGRITYVGSDSAALALRGDSTRVIDLRGQVVLPGLVDAHTHVAELGAALDRVNLTGIATRFV